MARKSSERPHVQPPDLDAIPECFKARRRWVSWRSERKPKGGWGKVPKNPATGDNASTTNDETWGTFDEAVAAMKTYGHDGIGYVFVAADGLIGLDLDHCLRPDGSPKTWALFWLRLFAALGAYIEESVSTEGVHVVLPANPPWGNDPDPIHAKEVPAQSGEEGGRAEIYNTERYFALTGRPVRRLPDITPTRPITANEAVRSYYDWLLSLEGQNEPRKTHVPMTKSHAPAAPDVLSARSPRMTNEEILARCRAMRNGKGEEFRALYDTPAKEKGKEDRSTIDWRLLLKLAWWTQDEDQLVELMEGSARKRDEWGARHGGTTKLRYDVRRCIAKKLASGQTYKAQPDQQDGAKGWSREEIDALPEAVVKDMLWSIYNVSMHPDLTPSDSRVTIVAWFLSRQFPGRAGDQEMVQIRRKDIATACHLSENTTGDILAHAADVGLLTRDPRRRKDGHIDLYVGAPSRVILTTEPIARSSRRKADVARKQCKHCKQSCYATQKWCRCGMKLDETVHGDDQDLVATLRDEISQKHSAEGWEYGFETVGGPPKRSALPYVPPPPTPSVGHLIVFWVTELVMDPAAQISQPALYSHYRTWCIEHNEDADDRVTFEDWITAQGATLEEGTWHGIGLAATGTDGAGCSPDPTLESAVGQADYENRAEVLTGDGGDGGPSTDSAPGLGGEMDTETPFGVTWDEDEEPRGCTSDPTLPQPPPDSAAGFTGRQGKPTRLQVYVHSDTDLEWDPEEPNPESAPGPAPESVSVLVAPAPPTLCSPALDQQPVPEPPAESALSQQPDL